MKPKTEIGNKGNNEGRGQSLPPSLVTATCGYLRVYLLLIFGLVQFGASTHTAYTVISVTTERSHSLKYSTYHLFAAVTG